MLLTKIKGTSCSISVETEGKTVKIQGELIVGGFAAYADTISRWEPPFEHVFIEEQEKQKLIDDIVSEAQKHNYTILFG